MLPFLSVSAMCRCWFACAAILVVLGLVTTSGRAQGPDLPPVPRMQGICMLTDGPRRDWTGYTAGLGVRLSFPQDWSPREVADHRLELLQNGRPMLRLWEVDTDGLAPTAWLQQRASRPDARGCRLMALGASTGQQCFGDAAQTWTTYLLTRRRVLAVEVPAAVVRETHCGILKSIKDLSR
ncbi:MAG: hypothetical protein ACT4P5_17775 [Armatimonadota bacterium]